MSTQNGMNNKKNYVVTLIKYLIGVDVTAFRIFIFTFKIAV